jgi:hypothetical protein
MRVMATVVLVHGGWSGAHGWRSVRRQRPMLASRNSEQLRQNESVSFTVTVAPWSRVKVTDWALRLKQASRSALEIAIPYPDPDSVGVPLDHPLPLMFHRARSLRPIVACRITRCGTDQY